MSKEKKNHDQDLFRQAMADVRPLTDDNRLPPMPARKPPVARQTAKDEQEVMAELLQENPLEPQAQTGDDLAWQQAGVQNRVLRRLRRGHYSCADTIDLHHMTENTARQVLLDFLQQACNHGPGCVRVIHGKGLRSRDVPVLKRMTASLLRRHPRVMAFASCRPVDGGTGATDVLLRAARGEPS